MRSKHLRRFLFIVFILLLYTGGKAVQLLPAHPWVASGCTVLLFTIMLTERLVYRTRPQIFDKAWFHLLTYAGSIVMGLWATFIILCLPVDLFRVGIWLIELVTGYRAISPNWFTAFYAWIVVAAFAFVILGFFQALRGPVIRKVSVYMEGLPKSLDGFKIAQISDLHVGPTIRQNYVKGVVERTNSTSPDIVIFTGDIADAHVENIQEHLQPLLKLSPRHGSYYITGNHEYYWNPQAIIAQIESLGFKTLLNTSIKIAMGEGKIHLGGITDPAGKSMLEDHTPDINRAAENAGDADVKILLSHRPGVAAEAEKLGFDLQFSGHTHSGQFFPFSLFIGLAHVYSRGLYRHGKMWLYVNPGTGYWGPVNRLGVTSEISLITLCSHPKLES